jgi:hypothetical protein
MPHSFVARLFDELMASIGKQIDTGGYNTRMRRTSPLNLRLKQPRLGKKFDVLQNFSLPAPVNAYSANACVGWRVFSLQQDLANQVRIELHSLPESPWAPRKLVTVSPLIELVRDSAEE